MSPEKPTSPYWTIRIPKYLLQLAFAICIGMPLLAVVILQILHILAPSGFLSSGAVALLIFLPFFFVLPWADVGWLKRHWMIVLHVCFASVLSCHLFIKNGKYFNSKMLGLALALLIVMLIMINLIGRKLAFRKMLYWKIAAVFITACFAGLAADPLAPDIHPSFARLYIARNKMSSIRLAITDASRKGDIEKAADLAAQTLEMFDNYEEKCVWESLDEAQWTKELAVMALLRSQNVERQDLARSLLPMRETEAPKLQPKPWERKIWHGPIRRIEPIWHPRY